MPDLRPIPLPYYGGKSPDGRAKGAGPWIASLLPWRFMSTYCEPFGGMFGVGFARKPTQTEIWNDLNDRLANYWRVWQEQPDELIWRVTNSVASRSLFEQDLARLDTGTALERAAALHRVVGQGVRHSDQSRHWKCHYKPGSSNTSNWTSARANAVAERMRRVQIECRPAVEILAKTAPYEEAVIYIDPPYPTADTSAYRHAEIDLDELAAAMWVQKGLVAVSGYRDEWDHLGWHKTTLDVHTSAVGANELPRTEVLWSNRPLGMAQAVLL